MGEKMGNDTSSEYFYCFSGPVCEHKQHLPINIDIFFFFFSTKPLLMYFNFLNIHCGWSLVKAQLSQITFVLKWVFALEKDWILKPVWNTF